MKLAIATPTEETPVVLGLKDAGYPEGAFDVTVTKSGGRATYYLVRFNPDGTMLRYEGVPEDFGFDLDNRGRVNLVEE